jgi:NADPH:quinone reductase
VPVHNSPIRTIAETLIIGVEDMPAEVRAATGGKGANVIRDLVGGVMFRSALKSLALRGRLVEIAATGQREVSFDLADFYQMKAGFSAWTRSSATSRRHRRCWMR